MAENFFQKTKDKPLTKELAQRIMEQAKGEARGMTLKTDWGVILRQKGKEGLEKLEEKMAEVGFPLKYKEIKTMAFYPWGLDIISVLAIRDVFGFKEKDFQELGASGVKISLFFKIILKYFSSLQVIGKQVPRFWREHFTVGELKLVKVSEEERVIIFRIDDFNVHPFCCAANSGYFLQTIKMMLNQPVTIKETKCMARGDNCHEFILSW